MNMQQLLYNIKIVKYYVIQTNSKHKKNIIFLISSTMFILSNDDNILF